MAYCLRIRIVAWTKPHQEYSSGADTIHFVFLDISESLDWCAMSYSSFVLNYLNFTKVGFTVYATVLLPKALITLTSLKSHSFTKRIHPSLPYGCSSQFDSRTSRSIAWDFAQLSTLIKLRTYDWLSLHSLGSNGSRKRSKNIFRGITIGIGPIWGIRSLSFILSWCASLFFFYLFLFCGLKSFLGNLIFVLVIL